MKDFDYSEIDRLMATGYDHDTELAYQIMKGQIGKEESLKYIIYSLMRYQIRITQDLELQFDGSFKRFYFFNESEIIVFDLFGLNYSININVMTVFMDSNKGSDYILRETWDHTPLTAKYFRLESKRLPELLVKVSDFVNRSHFKAFNEVL